MIEAVCFEREHGWLRKRDGSGFVCMHCREFRPAAEWQGTCSECHVLVKTGEMKDSPFPDGGRVCPGCYRNELSLLGADE